MYPRNQEGKTGLGRGGDNPGSASLFTWSPCVCTESKSPSSHRDTSGVGSGLTLRPSSHLEYTYKDPVSNKVTLTGTGMSTYLFRTQVNP